MKKLLLSFAVVASLAAVPASRALVKAHVPAHKEQVCHKGQVIQVGASAVAGHVKHGDAFIDKRTQIPPVFTGDDCP